MATVPADDSKVKLQKFLVSNRDVNSLGTEAAIVLAYLRHVATPDSDGNLFLITAPTYICWGTGMEWDPIRRALVILEVSGSIEYCIKTQRSDTYSSTFAFTYIRPTDEEEEEK